MTIYGESRNQTFWRGVSFGLVLATLVVSGLTGTFLGTGVPMALEGLGGAILGSLVLLAALLGTWIVVAILRWFPARVLYVAAAAMVVFAVIRTMRFGWPPSLFYPGAAAFLAAWGAFFGAFWALRAGDPRRGRLGLLLFVAILVNIAGVLWLASDGEDPYPVEMPQASSSPAPLELPDPSRSGDHAVETLTYGSGKDIRRPEFGDDVSWVSPTVDATRMLPEWKGFKAKARKWYWGHSLEDAPLNARVYAPAGDGPFPLALIVHGNHGMEDHSDGGYAYLGEMLASRGIIMASVDQNYINGTWSGDFRGREMPMRGWLLLEHLRLWREWNETPGHPFEGRVDMDRIALMGHSRGGEALGIAALYNQLPYFPDDANVRFDYGFNLRALVSIAQIDKRYIRRPELENVNFLALQGSYDSDEASFHGLRQYRRIDFTDERYWFKAGVYMHGGNHGQFNTSWGRYDSGRPGRWLLNVAPMISGEEQRRIAKVYIAAFLEATLHDDYRYLPLFRDPRAAGDWLPEDVLLLHQFEDSTFRPVADFDEDVDVTTASLSGATVQTEGLAVWREEELLYRDNLTQSTNGVVVGVDGGEGRYSILLPEGEEALELDGSSKLSFFLSVSTEKPTSPGEDEAEDEEDTEASDEDDADPLRIVVELEAADGTRASLALSDVAPVAPPLEIQFLKLPDLNRQRYTKTWEPSFQSFEIPLERFAGVGEGPLRAIRFLAEGTGVFILDDVGFHHGEPGPREPDAADEEVEVGGDEP